MRRQQQARRRRRRYNHGLRLKGPQGLDTFAFNQLEIISRAIIIVGAEIGVNPNIAEPGYPGFIIRRFRFGVLFFKAPITDDKSLCIGGGAVMVTRFQRAGILVQIGSAEKARFR